MQSHRQSVHAIVWTPTETHRGAMRYTVRSHVLTRNLNSHTITSPLSINLTQTLGLEYFPISRTKTTNFTQNCPPCTRNCRALHTFITTPSILRYDAYLFSLPCVWFLSIFLIYLCNLWRTGIVR